MSDQPMRTVTLPEADWQVVLAALYELPMKFAAPVAQRLQTALTETVEPEPRRPVRLKEAQNE